MACSIVAEKALINTGVRLEANEVMAQKPFPGRRWKIRLRIEEEGGHVVLEGPLPASLEVYEPWLSTPDHDVPGLEVTVQEVLRVSLEQVRPRRPVPRPRSTFWNKFAPPSEWTIDWKMTTL